MIICHLRRWLWGENPEIGEPFERSFNVIIDWLTGQFGRVRRQRGAPGTLWPAEFGQGRLSVGHKDLRSVVREPSDSSTLHPEVLPHVTHPDVVSCHQRSWAVHLFVHPAHKGTRYRTWRQTILSVAFTIGWPRLVTVRLVCPVRSSRRSRVLRWNLRRIGCAVSARARLRVSRGGSVVSGRG